MKLPETVLRVPAIGNLPSDEPQQWPERTNSWRRGARR